MSFLPSLVVLENSATVSLSTGITCSMAVTDLSSSSVYEASDVSVNQEGHFGDGADIWSGRKWIWGMINRR